MATSILGALKQELDTLIGYLTQAEVDNTLTNEPQLCNEEEEEEEKKIKDQVEEQPIQEQAVAEEQEVEEVISTKMIDLYAVGLLTETNPLLAELQFVENQVSKGDVIKIHINSFGGDWFVVLNIKNRLDKIREKGAKIVSVIEGYCCSAAVIIPLISDYVIAKQLSLFMIHKPFVVSDNNVALDTDTLVGLTQELELIWNGIVDLLRTRCQEQGVKRILNEVNKNGEAWLNEVEAREIGLVNEIERVNLGRVANYITPQRKEVKQKEITEEKVVIKPFNSAVEADVVDTGLTKFYKTKL